MDMINEAQKRIEENEKNIRLIRSQLKTAPEGSLLISSNKKPVEYYYKPAEDDKDVRIYIPKSNLSLAKKLAQKSYNKKCLKELLNEQKALQDLLEKYAPERKYRIYESLHPNRRELIEPLKSEVQKNYKSWQDEPCPSYDRFSESQRFETDRGEMVRSKSEVIIANFLNSNSDIVDYRYEKPLWIDTAGTYYHPDFTIFFLNSGRIMYHEHFGMMDDIEYVNEFTVKYNHYLQSGFIPGRDFLFTFETIRNPFSIQSFKSVILKLGREYD